MRKSINEKYILLLSHLTRGAWIEIFVQQIIKNAPECRTSHEVRGLKLSFRGQRGGSPLSHLTRGAWIEITHLTNRLYLLMSHLTRGAWIEMFLPYGIVLNALVAPHTRCVD